MTRTRRTRLVQLILLVLAFVIGALFLGFCLGMAAFHPGDSVSPAAGSSAARSTSTAADAASELARTAGASDRTMIAVADISADYQTDAACLPQKAQQAQMGRVELPSQAPAARAAPAARVVESAIRNPKSEIRLMRVTAYCPCRRCCGPTASGVTASGARVTVDGGRFVAADRAVLDFGSRVTVPGYAGGRAVRVRDTGSDIVGDRLDVFFASHAAARRWGVRWLNVTVTN